MIQKLYDIFNELYLRDYIEEDWTVWEKHLSEIGIDVFSWDRDVPNVIIKDLKEIICEGKRILVDDPQADYCDSEAWVQMSIPRELAEKIAVLGYVPMVSIV